MVSANLTKKPAVTLLNTIRICCYDDLKKLKSGCLVNSDKYILFHIKIFRTFWHHLKYNQKFMADSFSKKEKLKKKLEKQKEKALRREERKENNDKGKGLDDMIMYVDANGQLTSTPPDRSEEEEIELSDIQLGAAPIEPEETIKKGIVTFLSDKGYGFITEEKMKENVFFHNTSTSEELKKGNRVSFEIEKSPKGLVAVDIKLIK